MAGVEAIQLGDIVSGMVKSVQKPTAVSDNSNPFQHFLKDGRSFSAKQSESISGKDGSAHSVYQQGNENPYSRQDTIVKDSGQVMTAEQKTGMENPDETLAELQEAVRDLLKEKLNLTDEGIDQLLDFMGISFFDLFNPQILQQFVLQLHGGEENMDFLFNENMMNDFSELQQALESFLSDDMKALVAQMEPIDTPVTLDEFLTQEGAEHPDLTANTETAVEADTASSFAETVVEAETTPSAAEIPESLLAVQEEKPETAMVEKITVHTEETADTKEMVSGMQETADEEQSSFSQDFQEKDSSEMLFARSEDMEKAPVPVITEQFDMSQNQDFRLFMENVPENRNMQQMIDIINQVSNSIRNVINANTTTMEVQLNPESLGKVFLSVISKDGVMTATFHVQTDEAKNALESQMYQLRESLESKDLKVESVDVQISDFSFSQSNEADGQGQNESQKKDHKRFRYDSEISEETERSEEETAQQVRERVMHDSGGSIDFTA